MTTTKQAPSVADRPPGSARAGAAIFTATLLALAALCAPAASLAQTPDRSNDFYQDWLLNCAVQRTGDVAAAPKPPETKPPEPGAKPASSPANSPAATPAAAGAATKTNTICEMVQTFRNRTNNQTIAIVALGKPEPGAERKFVIQVPVGVWLPDGISLTSGKTSVAGQYLRCSPSVCIAQADAKKEVLDALKTGEVALEFSDAGRTRARLTISGKGFSDALAALDKRS